MNNERELIEKALLLHFKENNATQDYINKAMEKIDYAFIKAKAMSQENIEKLIDDTDENKKQIIADILKNLK